MQNKKLMTFAESINSALKTTMTKNKKVFLNLFFPLI